MTPRGRNTILFCSSQPTPSSPSRTLEGLFELTWCSSRTLNSPHASGTTEIQGHSQVCRTRRGSLRKPSTTTDKNLDGAFVENALFYTDPWKTLLTKFRIHHWLECCSQLTTDVINSWWFEKEGNQCRDANQFQYFCSNQWFLFYFKKLAEKIEWVSIPG